MGVPVCNALLAFGKEKYDEVHVWYDILTYVTSELVCIILQVLQIMVPLRYDFLNFGGSWAQRQVFNTTLIQAAINANKLQLALELVSELKVL